MQHCIPQDGIVHHLAIAAHELSQARTQLREQFQVLQVYPNN
jgi:hypothetical protein